MTEKVALTQFVVFKELRIGPALIEPKRIKVPYHLIKKDGTTADSELIYTYSEKVFDSKSGESINLASMMGAQVAINYGLFCEQLVFDGHFDESDQRFTKDMVENTSREIYVNKLLIPNEFIKSAMRDVQTEKKKRYTAAEIVFIHTNSSDVVTEWSHSETRKDEFELMELVSNKLNKSYEKYDVFGGIK